MPYSPRRPFTKRQRQVIEGIRRGRTNQEIADELAIGTSAVQGLIDRIVMLLRNPDDLRDRECIFQFAWWELWHEQLVERELRRQEDASLEDTARSAAD